MDKIPEYYKNSSLTEQAEIQRKKELDKKIKQLYNLIQKDFDKEKDSARKNVLMELLKIKCYSERNYEALEFLYNYGRFRTTKEIEDYNNAIQREMDRKFEQQRMEAARNYFSSGQYEEDCGNPIKCWIPFFINIGLFIISLLSLNLEMFWMTLFPLPITLGISMFIRARYSDNCIDIAQEHKYYYKSSPKYNKEVTTLNGLYIGGVAAAMSSYHSISTNLKQVCNPDSWDVLK